MTIIINGKQEILNNKITLLELINLKELNPENIVIEYNEKIIKKEELNNTFINENDIIEMISFVGGG